MKPLTDFLFVSTQDSIKTGLAALGADCPFRIVVAERFDDALKVFDRHKFKVVYFDISDEELRSLQILEWLKTRFVTALIGIITDPSPADFQALRLQATRFLPRAELSDVSRLKERLRDDLAAYDSTVSRDQRELAGVAPWIGRTSGVRGAFAEILRLASLSAPVMLSGEAGTGKRHLLSVLKAAETRHRWVDFDAAQIPVVRQKQEFLNLCSGAADAIAVAHIESLIPELQERLVRHVMDGAALIPESPKTWRLVATATKSPLLLVQEGRLREDLAWILNANLVTLSPLRERSDDVALLADAFLEGLPGDGVYSLSNDAKVALESYPWPGNVAELKTVLTEVGKAHAPGLISARLLPAGLVSRSFYRVQAQNEVLSDFSYLEAKHKALEAFNRAYLQELLERSQNNLTVAAEKAGMDRSNFKKIMKKYL